MRCVWRVYPSGCTGSPKPHDSLNSKTEHWSIVSRALNLRGHKKEGPLAWPFVRCSAQPVYFINITSVAFTTAVT